MKATTARRMAWGLLAFGVALAGGGLTFSALNGARGDFLENSLFGLIFMSMGVVGALIASRQPGNAIGWLLLWTTLVVAIAFVSDEYAIYTVVTDPGALPGGVWAAWVSGWAWAVGIAPMVTFLFLLFPDGHLGSRRWRPVAWAAGGALFVIAVAGMLHPEQDTSLPARNPIGIESAGRLLDGLLGAGFLFLVVLGLLSAASLVLRFHRSRG
ncbi:MAG: hypothetical protein ACRDHK_03970, partial [Actinomycetota bacterium]